METYYHHYITVDADGRITDGWSDGPRAGRDTTGAVCISEEGGYQFRLSPDGEENPPLHTVDGIPLYKWTGKTVEARADAEIAADRAALPAPEPTQAERMEAQITYTAIMTDTLLEV